MTLLLCVQSTNLFARTDNFLPATFTSKFEQEYVSALKGKIKKGFGTIEYKFPGQIRFESTTPSSVIYTSNGSKSWYYRAPFIEGEQGEVSESAVKNGDMAYIKFFDSLRMGLTSNKFYDVQKGDIVNLKFKLNSQKALGISESQIYFKKNGSQKFSEIEFIELTFPDGKKAKLKFLDLKTDIAINDERFNFISPPNTKKVN